MHYKSQKGQDKWVIEEVFPNKKGGYFLDLAAANGITNSNTYILEKQYGWEGLAIEPNPNFYAKLKKRACKTSDRVVSGKRQRVTFRIDNGQLGGIVAEDTDNWVRGDQLQDCETIEVDAYPLLDVLKDNDAPSHIDYWSLDVEGSEESILSTFNFSEYSFGCITIERPTPRCNQILQSNGYVFIKNQTQNHTNTHTQRHNADTFYVHPKNLGNMQINKFAQVPPKPNPKP